MYDKKTINFKSPDLSKMQAVKIDIKTIIYIALGDDPVKARMRYLERAQSTKL